MLTNRFRVLVAEKATREQRNISLREVARETGLSLYTVTAFANNKLRELPVDMLHKLCEYLNVTPGDLLKVTPTERSVRKKEQSEEIYRPSLAAA